MDPKNGKFSTNVLKLIGGTTIAQIITIVASPILTRLYGPESFGLYAIFTSISGLIIIIACLRYELSIMLPESDEEAINLLGLCILITIIISIITIPIIWFGGAFLSQLFNAPDLELYLFFIPPLVFISGIFLAQNYWNSRTKHFGRLSVTRVTNSIVTNGTQIGVGYLGYTNGGSLIGASVFGHYVATIVLSGQILKDDFKLMKKNLSLKRMQQGFVRYKKFPLMDTISSFLNSLSWQLPIFLLSAFFSPVIVGFYALGFRILQLPMSLVGNSISQVFFQKAAFAKRNNQLSILVKTLFEILIIIGLFPMLIMTIIGQDIFYVVFGSQWAEAGIYAQILSIWALIWFISSPLSTLYIVLEKQEFGLFVTLINFSTRLISLFIGGWLGSVTIALILFAISGIFVYGYLCIKLLNFSGVDLNVTKKIIVSNFIMFIPAGVTILILKFLNVNQIILILISTLILMVYYGYVVISNKEINNLVNIVLKRKIVD